ncbi:hypothetical protein BH09VER1_BH09VER1_38450 [soil metagenome]
MKIWIFSLLLTSSLWAEDSRLEIARQALADGLPQAAIYKLRSVTTPWASKDDEIASRLLLARALIAAGRNEESVPLLQPMAATNSEAAFWLAEAFSTLGKPADALALYARLTENPEFSDRAVIGQARMLKALNRSPEAIAALAAFYGQKPDSAATALELARTYLEMGNEASALKVLGTLHGASSREQQIAEYLAARALLMGKQAAQAEEKLRGLHDPPAMLAADIAIALAEARVLQGDRTEAEKSLEVFIDTNSRLPGLADVFVALNRVYASQGAASSTELRRWAENTKDAPRAALALFYLARNEARNSKIERSRDLYKEFLASNPLHPLADEARAELGASLLAGGQAEAALQELPEGHTPRIDFLRGEALDLLGKYKEAASAFLTASLSTELVPSALSNSAISAFYAGIPDAQNQALLRLQKMNQLAALEKVRFFQALHQASLRQPGSGDLLKKIAESNSPFAQQAQLSLAEWDYLQGDLPAARNELIKVSDIKSDASTDPKIEERSQFLAMFLADMGTSESDAEVAKLAQAFLDRYPGSAFEPEVCMKLGEILFRRGNYLGARAQFDDIRDKFPNSPLVEKALFLSAQAMARSMDPNAMQDAIAVYEKVAKAGGPLALRARLAQAMLWSSMKNYKDAFRVFDSILQSNPDPDLRDMTLIEKGDTYNTLGPHGPENYTQAIAAWKQIVDDPKAPKNWSYQAQVKMGAAYEKLGNTDAALDCYYAVFSQPQKGNPEYFWYYKAGFDAGSLLERQKLWKEAIAVYDKIGSIEGPRSEEARERVNKLRLENFIWDN